MKRKANYKAKRMGGAVGRSQESHESGKRAGKKPVIPIPKKDAVKADGFEAWAEEMVSNPLKFLSYTVIIIFVAVCIKILIF